jgi:hypothetical protein
MNLDKLERVTTVNTGKVTRYYEAHNLYTNLLKSNFLLFHMKRSKVVCNLMVVKNNKEIKEEHSTNFIGVILDNNLTFCSTLIQFIVGLLLAYLQSEEYHIRDKLHKKKNTQVVFTLQKILVRCIAGLKLADSCQESFDTLNIFTLFSSYIY